ncbi:hypothetical protein H696_00290 [Fonticula alba]|uniref:SCP2 domain-containing protein n=1 Tax=Fonticula alba TaxID=691883 RepID=A0A058ZGU6_FONAL|nr:hypothetical protein H696_00290 [Fonticula alba]KCV72712.1 hypothetical protein H696_00290 [Fonticula alba]|eukprot:XP_009492413.1 hypothetical protein H696_00290 [Fonticula alba]
MTNFESEQFFKQLKDGVSGLPSDAKDRILKQVNGLFQFDITNSEGVTKIWTLDLKAGTATAGSLVEGPISGRRPDVILKMTDENFAKMARGELNGQKAFMAGQLKVRGKIVLATKLDTILKTVRAAA